MQQLTEKGEIFWPYRIGRGHTKICWLSLKPPSKILHLRLHVQHIQICSTATYLYHWASCLPELRKDGIIKLALTLNSQTLDIVYATCGCPTGKGPIGSCKHISSSCFAFVEFCKCGANPGFLTCTDKLQSWKKLRSQKVYPIPVDQLTSRRNELTYKNRRSLIYNPRPHCFRKECPASVERLHRDHLNANITGSCALLTILVPTLERIKYDHTYALPYPDVEPSVQEEEPTCLTDQMQNVRLSCIHLKCWL